MNTFGNSGSQRELQKLNVKTTFLQGEMDETIYLKQQKGFIKPSDEGFIRPGDEEKVCWLKRIICGLKHRRGLMSKC